MPTTDLTLSLSLFRFRILSLFYERSISMEEKQLLLENGFDANQISEYARPTTNEIMK